MMLVITFLIKSSRLTRRGREGDNLNTIELKLEVAIAGLPGTNVTPLLVTSNIPKGERPNAYACNTCGRCYFHRDSAESCCKAFFCKVCGIKTQKHLEFCRKHFELEVLKTAPKVEATTYTGHVYAEGIGEEYFENLDELLEYCDCEDVPVPAYVYTCIAEKWQGVDSHWAIADLDENHYDDAYEDIVDYKELVKFLEDWNAKQTIVSYSPDTSIIVLDNDLFEAELAKS